jgi:GxxExxY protein
MRSSHALNQISEKIIGCAFKVSNALGDGYLEKVYENALAHELRKAGLSVLQQHGLKVYYDNVVVGEYVPDLFVEDEVIVELKAIKALQDTHVAQCINYLKTTGLRLCLLLNFGRRKMEVRRLVRDL